MTVHDAVTVLKKIRHKYRYEIGLGRRCTELIACISFGGKVSPKWQKEIRAMRTQAPIRL